MFHVDYYTIKINKLNVKHKYFPINYIPFPSTGLTKMGDI
jgi:hypothetical protein